MSDQKPKLKLKFGGPKKGQDPQDPGKAAAAPQPATPATPKITLKIGSAFAATPPTPKVPPSAAAPAGPKPSKSGRKPKPTAKKRTLDTAQADDAIENNESDSEPLANTKKASSSQQPPIKKIKITTSGGAGKGQKAAATAAVAAAAARRSSGPTNIRFKRKGRVPERPLGVGYDSEASDREDDPTIHETLILRMAPGEDSEYLRQAISNGTLGATQDLTMRFVTSNGRRACLTIRGRQYAAVLVDLPCVVEAMKSWNKKEFYKSADICQMLLVLGRVGTDEEAISFDVRRAVAAGLVGKGELDEKTWAWAHGLTPPMRWVRKRRFRKRISTKLVEEDEREVERLLKDDADAKGGFTYRHVDLDALEREQAEADAAEQEQDDYDDYDDAEGEVDDGYDAKNSGVRAAGVVEDNDDDDLEAHLEAEMLKQAHEGEIDAAAVFAGDNITDSPAPIATNLADTAVSPPLTASVTATPSFENPVGATATGSQAIDTPSADNDAPSSDVSASGSPSSSDDDDDDDDDEDGNAGDSDAPDDDALEEQQDRQRMREEIADLEAAIAREEQRLQVTPNQILKQKIAKTIRGLRADLELKVGGGDEDGDGVDGGGAGGAGGAGAGGGGGGEGGGGGGS